MMNDVMGVSVRNWIAAGVVVAITVALFVVFRRIQRDHHPVSPAGGPGPGPGRSPGAAGPVTGSSSS